MNRLRMTLLFYIAALLCLSTACGGQKEEPAQTDWSPAQMARAVWDSQPALGGYPLSSGDGDFEPYLRDSLGVDPADVAEGAVLYAGGVNAQEVVVLRMAEEEDVEDALKTLADYADARAGAFAGYAPEQYDIAEGAAVAERGRYAMLFIVPDQDAARDAMAGCFLLPPPEEPPAVPVSGEPDPVPEPEVPVPAPEPAPDVEPDPVPAPDPVPEPEPDPVPEPGPDPETHPAPEPDPAPPAEPWTYDQARIVTAWTSGDRTGLYQEDLDILAVLEQIPALADPDLSLYQRELALHDWMLDWAEYDPGALSSGPIGEPMPHNDDPYGFLTGRKGICTGYASTFQLLMELAGVECLTVVGVGLSTDDHAWNMVKLDGEWYCVDPTWDLRHGINQDGEPVYGYFNVTSDWMAFTDHQWDYDSVPEATAEQIRLELNAL